MWNNKEAATKLHRLHAVVVLTDNLSMVVFVIGGDRMQAQKNYVVQE
jgi:hypothetical protein